MTKASKKKSPAPPPSPEQVKEHADLKAEITVLTEQRISLSKTIADLKSNEFSARQEITQLRTEAEALMAKAQDLMASALKKMNAAVAREKTAIEKGNEAERQIEHLEGVIAEEKQQMLKLTAERQRVREDREALETIKLTPQEA